MNSSFFFFILKTIQVEQEGSENYRKLPTFVVSLNWKKNYTLKVINTYIIGQNFPEQIDKNIKLWCGSKVRRYADKYLLPRAHWYN